MEGLLDEETIRKKHGKRIRTNNWNSDKTM